LKGTSQKVKRANILLKVDADGPAWADQQIADAFRCRRQTVENVRKKFVLEGFYQALEHKKPAATRPKSLDGKQEAQIIAMRLGEPPKGYGKWTLRLLARKAVELEVVESISHESVRTTLKKTA
jgi:transposase